MYNTTILLVIGSFLLSMYVIAVILHILGIYLVYNSANRMQQNQRIYLINFSIAEIAMSFSQMTYIVGHMIQYRPLQVYASIVQCTLAISWCCTMIVLTVDRFLEIKLNIKYPLYVTKGRVIFASSMIWILDLMNLTWMVYMQGALDFDVIEFVFKAIFPAFETMFLATCIGVYVYIFIKVKEKTKTAKKIRASQKVKEAKERRLEEKRRKETKARNFVPFYIIVTFLIFSSIPELITVLFLHVLKMTDQRSYIMYGVVFLFVIGYIVDAIIYIYMYRQLRTLLCRKLFKNKIRNLGKIGDVTMTTAHPDFQSAY